MTQPISFASATSFATELAELLIQNETSQTDADRAQRDAARATFLKDAQQQVDELHEAASATEMGALASGISSVLAGACAIGATEAKFQAETTSPCDSETIARDNRTASILGSVSKGFSDLGAPVKTMVFDTAVESHKAEATRFETLSEQAKWQAGDASSEIDKTNALGSKILDTVQSLNQDQNAAANAVIGRI